MAKSLKERQEKAFEAYYAMKKRNLPQLAIATGETLATLVKWNEALNWRNRIAIRDGETRDAQISMMCALTQRQLNIMSDKLDEVENGVIFEVGEVAKVSAMLNNTRDSLIRSAQYEDEHSARLSSKDNTEVLNKLEGLKKDMKELGLSGVQFDSASSILDGE